MSIMFSIVVPAYNAAAYITETLDSVAAQECQDFELIVTDDGSSDGTGNVVRAWIAAAPHLNARVVAQENRGIGGARNTGVRHATGVFVSFLDADDRWAPEKLAETARQLSLPSRPDLVCHDLWVEGPSGRRRIHCGPHRTFERLLFSGNCLFTSATTVRRSVLAASGGFSEVMDYNGVEDWELWLRLFGANVVVEYLPEPLGFYREGHGISANVEAQCRSGFAVFELHYASLSNPTLGQRWRRRQFRAGLLRWAANVLRQQGDTEKAWAYVVRALRENPVSFMVWGVGAATAATHLARGSRAAVR